VPAHAVRVTVLPQVPLTSNGKTDYGALGGLAALAEQSEAAPIAAPDSGSVHADFVRVLGRPDARDDDSFVDLGGDSLSYVELATRLAGHFGHGLPTGWHTRTIGELQRLATDVTVADAPRSRWARLDTTVALRALAILFVVASHVDLVGLEGGAHLLLALAGFNFARFQLTSRPRRERVRGIVRSVSRVVLPSAAWIGVVALVAGTYDWRNVLMLNQVLGDWAQWSDHWHYWFIEAVTSLLLGTALLMAVPAVDRWERRWPFAFPLALVGLGLLTRYAVLVPDAGPYRGANAYVLVWLFATGWAAARASTTWRRLLVSAIPVLTVPGFWPSMPGREVTIIVGLLALIWFPTARVPRWVGRAASQIATASLFVYLTHFVVYPRIMGYSSVLAMACCLVVGIAYCRLWTGLEAAVRRGFRTLVARRDLRTPATSRAGRTRTPAGPATDAPL
jgi:hypothetical protein